MKKKVLPSQQIKGKNFSRNKPQEKMTSGLAICDTVRDVEMTIEDTTSEKRHLQVSQSEGCFLKFLNEDRQKQQLFCDTTVVVSGKIFYAHRVVLAFGSGYFHARFSESPEVRHVSIYNMEGSTFGHLLNFLYTSEFKVSESQISAVAQAAGILEMMEAVKLLATLAVPAQPDEAPQETLTSQTSSEAKSSFCSRTFHHKKTVTSLLTKTYSTGCLVEDGQNMATTSGVATRRSTRQKRLPAKFSTNAHAESGSPSQRTSESSDVTFEVEEEDEYEDVQKNEGQEHSRKERQAETSATIQVEEAESEDVKTPEERVDGTLEKRKLVTSDAEDEEHSPKMEVFGQDFPEGLDPIVVQSPNKKTLKCPKCDKTFNRIGKYKSHTRVHTGEKPFQCDVCLQCYSTKSNLTVHKKKHQDAEPVQRKEHKCHVCNKLHASRKTLIRHVKRFHPDNLQEFFPQKKKKSEGWKCEVCLKSFSRRSHLEEHMILHSQDKPFKCAYCDECFKSRFARLKHQEKFHLGPFPCDICGRQFADTGNLKRHVECTHGGKRKWTCFLCGKSVRERTTLREHMRIHSGEKPHLCSVCGQSFRHRSSYRSVTEHGVLHLRVHHEDKRYECDECGKTFIRHDHLTKHQKIHTGERAHQCEECGKCFSRADHLTVHYKSIHLGEKIWKRHVETYKLYKAVVHECQVCKREFRGKTNLMAHFRTHSGEKPHRCEICNQSFCIKKTLTKHMVIHSDVRPFSCPHCSATFKRKDKLKYHVDHVHSTRHLDQQQQNLPAANANKLTTPLHSNEASKACPNQTKTVLQSASADVCVPVTIDSLQISEETVLGGQGASHIVHPTVSQEQQTGYQPTPDLVFLEKYTLTPQPANLVHPVRPEQMLDPRDQSYLGSLLGLGSAATVQNISGAEHTH
ncbi:hypothetical protein DNTS_029803 [Danionella cerebrum]|uniref:Zinc finger and BTB domain-containing protein 41 n=1 Tax=Danionella cerebrum TaxID=2873325 RepID=A0A553MLA3_9TELE|nr:hypothetical protein DNTS_029803 [Danionella translucida]TRY53961.1 hypothetical protein DNTS_029803 [Danionella translucida]